MPKIVDEFFMNNHFKYSSYSCFCEKEEHFVSPGEPTKCVLKLCTNINNPVLFSYNTKNGLNQTGNAGGLISRNILSQLLSIKNNNIDAAISFIKNYGFFFPVSTEEYDSVDADALMTIINRIKATIFLMGTITGKHEYEKMLIYTTYLLFTEPVHLTLKSFEYNPECHPFTKLIESYNNFPNMDRNQEVFDTKKFTVDDTIFPNGYKIDIDFFNAVRSGDNTLFKGVQDSNFKHIFALYTGYPTNDIATREIIDFYFHYQMDVAVFKEISCNKIVFYGQASKENFSDSLKSALLKIAKSVVGFEINQNIKKVSPQYDVETLSPSWQLNNLLEALYFSIFYMKSNTQLYRECKNPNCKKEKYFLVNATNETKQYCCPNCREAASQHRCRQRKLQNK